MVRIVGIREQRHQPIYDTIRVGWYWRVVWPILIPLSRFRKWVTCRLFGHVPIDMDSDGICCDRCLRTLSEPVP